MPQDIPAGYPDVITVLRAARRAGGASYSLPTPGAAINWCQRAYRFRKLMMTKAQESAPLGIVATTEWDDMVLTLDRKNKSSTVKITFGTIKGELHDLDGNPLSQDNRVTSLPPAPREHNVASDDPLLAEALELVSQLEEE
jgi:hypothetical protein